MQPLLWHPPVGLSEQEEQIVKRIRRAKLFVFLRHHRHELLDEAFQQELAGLRTGDLLQSLAGSRQQTLSQASFRLGLGTADHPLSSSAGNAFCAWGCCPFSERNLLPVPPESPMHHQFQGVQCRAKLRERVAVEHTLAHVGRWQGQRARYRGVHKNLFDLRRCAVIHNLHVQARSQQLSIELQDVA